MTREEFIQECALRMVAPGKTDNDHLISIYRFSTDLARCVYGPTEEEKKIEQEEESRQMTWAEEEEKRKAERSERLSKRAKELKAMPKQYVITYCEYKYNSWKDSRIECHVKSSAVMNQEDIVKKELQERKTWSYDILAFEYCFITDEQANNILSNEAKKGHNSKELTGINSSFAWDCLIDSYGLEVVRTMKI